MRGAERELVLTDVQAADRDGAIRELVSALARQEKFPAAVEKEMLEAVLERERLHSTALGNGLAIPHARTDRVQEVKVVLGRSREGLDFGAPDRKPVHLVFLFVSPRIGIQIHAEALARLAKQARDRTFDRVTVASMRENDLWELMEEAQGGTGGPKR